MNEITAAIKKKAEEKYPDNPNECLSEYGDRMRDQICYTCGGEDAIGFMLKFVEWVGEIAHYTKYNGAFCWEITLNDEDFEGKEYCSTKELLIKYMEDNKL